MKACIIEGCDTIGRAKGMCNKHYKRLARNGTTHLPPRPSTAERFWSKVDKTDGCWEWNSAELDAGYGMFWMGGSHKLAHRVSYEMEVGPIPDGLFIDHRCGNRACVRPDHLRPATAKQNAENLRGARADSQSGVRGVRWDARMGRYRCQVTHEGEVFYLGSYISIQEANEVVTDFRLELFTHNEVDRRVASWNL